MKKLLFLSLLISVPLWGMEAAPPNENDSVTELFYIIDSEKQEMLRQLKKRISNATEEESAILQKAKEAMDGIANYLIELNKKQNDNQRLELKVEVVYLNWCHFYIEQTTLVKPRKYLGYLCGGIRYDVRAKMPFSYTTLESFLTKLPYVIKVARSMDEQ